MNRLHAVLAAVLLTAACANGSVSTAQPGSPGSTPAVAPSATVAPTPSVAPSATSSPWVDESPPAIPTGSCGSAHLAQGGAVVMDGAAALRCFDRAARTCTAASLGYSELMVDSGHEVQATIVPATPCQARYISDGWSANGGGSTSAKTTEVCTVTTSSKHVDFACPTLTDEIPVG